MKRKPSSTSADPFDQRLRFVAYYRVSTQRQGQSGLGLDAQRASVAASVEAVDGVIVAHHTEVESGANNSRPELAKALADCRRTGAALLIAKLDRLARNVAFISNLMESGVEFIAADFPQANRLTIHILAAVAEHERELIRDRTIAGLDEARKRGRVGGNPALKAKDPEAIERCRRIRVERYERQLTDRLETWLPTVKRLRPNHSWNDITQLLNAAAPVTGGADDWTVERLQRAAHWAIRQGLADKTILARAPTHTLSTKLQVLAVAIHRANPALSLRQIGKQLEDMRERTPRGGTRWNASSVKHLLDKALSQEQEQVA